MGDNRNKQAVKQRQRLRNFLITSTLVKMLNRPRKAIDLERQRFSLGPQPWAHRRFSLNFSRVALHRNFFSKKIEKAWTKLIYFG
jgi:hypothetical protein